MYAPVISETKDTEGYMRIFTCQKGETFIIRPADKRDYGLILNMYDRFEPKESAQGLPPADPERRQSLVHKILDESLNVISETDGFVAGHACLIDIDPGVRAELVIVIHQDWQNCGLGSAMLSLLFDLARQRGYHKVWLTVDARNRRAISIYRKQGFAFVGPFDSEREMELILR
jgi:RimJ/RimL family protein N-acetyltransferase